MNQKETTFVPLGISDYFGNTEKGYVEVQYLIKENNAKKLTIQIRNGNKIIYEEEITDEVKLTKGKHLWKWDGFDNEGILDTEKLTNYDSLNFYLIGINDKDVYKMKKVDFNIHYTNVKWIDIKINKNTKRIEVKLRVNLRDGGEIGTENDCYETGSGSYAPITKHCPWDKIPIEEINPIHPVLKARDETNNFEALKQLALEGIGKYWGRNSGNIEKGVYINDELYEVYINAKSDIKGMVAPKIIYFTNSKHTTFNRSHNWFASRKLYYKEGYLKGDAWYYRNSLTAIKYFEETAAHEIGHELLTKLAGEYKSYTHKGSSHPSVIIQNPVKGTRYPTDGEIDLMKYADDSEPEDYYDRVILCQKDLLGLLWLTKLKLKK